MDKENEIATVLALHAFPMSTNCRCALKPTTWHPKHTSFWSLNLISYTVAKDVENRFVIEGTPVSVVEGAQGRVHCKPNRYVCNARMYVLMNVSVCERSSPLLMQTDRMTGDDSARTPGAAS